jgi:sulfide:quinone oxidoreductase
VKWLRDEVTFFSPAENRLQTCNGQPISYETSVVCPGIQLD